MLSTGTRVFAILVTLFLVTADYINADEVEWPQMVKNEAVLEGIVTDNHGNPLADVTVQLAVGGTQSIHARSTTSVNGQFSLSFGKIGSYQLSIIKEGYKRFNAPLVDDFLSDGLNIEVKMGTIRSDLESESKLLEIFLETDERISDREGMLIGRMMAFRMSQSDDWDDFEKLDFRNDIRQLEGKIRRERNNISKEELELLYIEYLAFAGIKTKVSGIEDEKVFTGELDKNLIKEALENIKPSSNFWYLYPQALRGGIENLPDQKDFIRSYLDQVIQNNTSTDLVSQVLLYALHFASQSNDSDLFDIYLGTLLSYYPETSGAYRAKRDFDIPSSISVGEKVPSFSITNLDGPVALNNQIMQGKYYLIDFWSTGCGGCIQAMPHH